MELGRKAMSKFEQNTKCVVNNYDLNLSVYCKYNAPEVITHVIILTLSRFLTTENFYMHVERFTSFREHASQI
jgi:hypothetical protein